MRRMLAALGAVGKAMRGRVRVLLAGGAAFGLLLTGTYAIWTDGVTATTGSFSSGTVQVRLGPDGVQRYTMTIGADSLWPGQSATETFSVRNTGTLPITFTSTKAVAGTWTSGGVTALDVTVAGGSGTLPPGGTSNVTVTATFNASKIKAVSGTGSFQDASGDVVITFDATNS